MGKNKNFKREEKKIGGGSLADQFAAFGFATTVDKDENKLEIPENAFINPYTFIPIGGKEPNRKKPREALEGEKLYDGYLDCSLEIKSSTYIPNTSKKFEYLGDGTEHYFYDFFSYEDLSNCNTNEVPDNPPKYPRIPGSEIRGMVRNVYEQLTNSCLSVIDEENLPYKRTPKPKKAGLLDIASMKLYKAERVMLNSRNRYATATTGGVVVTPGTYSSGDEVYIVKSSGTYTKNIIGRMGNTIQIDTRTHVVNNIRRAVGGIHTGECKGYVLIGEDFNRKHHDSVIVGQYNVAGNLTGTNYNMTEADINRFENVLKNYNGKSVSDNIENLEHQGTSYRSYIDYYIACKNHNSGIVPVFYSQVGENIYLSPAMITKEVFESTISSLLRDNHNRHEPCSGDEGCFCPACRLFGMVGKGQDKNAVASRIRFTDTEVFENPKFDEPRVPEVLGIPRYSSTEFYLKRPDEKLGAELWNYDYYVKYRGTGMKATTEATPYKAQLSGRKVYWKGIDKLEDAPNIKFVEKKCREDRNYIKDNQLKMRQAIRALKAENKTTFRIYFENITGEELGGLLFCVNLSDEAIHRIGKGKPLGMGAVKTSVTGVNILEYKLEEGEIKTCTKTVSQDEFKYNESYKHNVKNIVKYLTPLTGKEAEIVDYPKPADKKDGKIFEWFVKNRGTTILQPKLGQTLPELRGEKKYLLKN